MGRGDEDMFSTVQSVRSELDASGLLSSGGTFLSSSEVVAREEHHSAIAGRSIHSSHQPQRHSGMNQYEVFEESAWGFRINDLQEKVIAERKIGRDKDVEITALKQALQRCGEEGWKEKFHRAEAAIAEARGKERKERERAEGLEAEVDAVKRLLREAGKDKERSERCLDELRLAERTLIIERDAAVARFETGMLDPGRQTLKPQSLWPQTRKTRR